MDGDAAGVGPRPRPGPGLLCAVEPGLDPAEFIRVMDESGLRAAQAPCDDGRLRAMLAGASFVVTARDHGRLVGVARCVTDSCWCCFLSDLAVCRAVQGQGIGRALLAAVCGHVGDGVSVILMAGADVTGFYEREGLERVEAAFWRRRAW